MTSSLERTLRGLLALLLLWAAISKLGNPTEFYGSILAYELPLPRALVQATAVVLPWIELLCGLMLLAGFWTPTALLTITGLMVIFVVATGQAWARGIDISCGCFNLTIFGLHESAPGLSRFIESVAFAFFRNLLLTALAAFLLWRTTRAPQPAESIATS